VPSQPIVINDPTFWNERRSRRKDGTLGKSRVSLEVESEPIAHNFDSRIGAPTAKAIREVIAEGIRNISAVAKPATLQARKYAFNAYQRGANWAKRRYGGGRIGDTPPDLAKVRLFNFSGRLADHLFTRFNRSDETFTTNVPGNRFDERVWDSTRRQNALERLSDLVPALKQAGRLMNDPRVQAGMSESLSLMIDKLSKTRDVKRAQLRRQRLAVLKAIVGLVA
jgi:hypothetical protein